MFKSEWLLYCLCHDETMPTGMGCGLFIICQTSTYNARLSVILHKNLRVEAKRVLTLLPLVGIIMAWQFRDKSAYAVGMSGILEALTCQRNAHTAITLTGIVRSGNKAGLKNKNIAGPVITAPDRRKESRMNTHSQSPKNIIPDNPLLTNELSEFYLKQCLQRGLSKETIRSYASYLRKFAIGYPQLPLDPDVIQEFIGTYLTGDERRHGCYRTLRAFYNVITVRNNISNPMRYVIPPRRKPKEKPALTMAEVKILLEYPGHSPDIRAVLYFLADTGARIGEVYNLTSNDIFENSVRLSGKTGERIVPVSPHVGHMLRQLGPGRLFGKHSLFRLRRKVSQAFKAAGFDSGSAHMLRHTFCTLWRGSDLCLKTITGHKSWSMIENYSHRRLEKAIEEHKKTSPLAQLNEKHNTPKPPTEIDSNTEPDLTDTPYSMDPDLGLPVRQILQIIPATGWKAVFALEPDHYDSNGHAVANILRKPLICFALVKNPDGTTDLYGFDANEIIIAVDDIGNFLGYEGPDETLDYCEQWQDWLKDQPADFIEVGISNPRLRGN